jgi:hypothetical protein
MVNALIKTVNFPKVKNVKDVRKAIKLIKIAYVCNLIKIALDYQRKGGVSLADKDTTLIYKGSALSYRQIVCQPICKLVLVYSALRILKSLFQVTHVLKKYLFKIVKY